MQNFRQPTAGILIIIGALSRLIPHPANFTTLGATAIFSGAKLSRPWNYFIPLLILLTTDIVLGFHKTMIFVYLSFAATTFLSELTLRNRRSLFAVGGLGVANSIVFFIITNFGVWLTTSLYPQTLTGLTESYFMGLPFLRSMVIADIIFSVGFFALYEQLTQNQEQPLIKKIVVRQGGK